MIIQGSFPGGRPHQSVINQAAQHFNLNIKSNNFNRSNSQVQPFISNGNKNAFNIDASRLKLQGVGSPLPNEVLQKMEGLFKTNFKNIRIHTNDGQAESIGALAFATGNNIYFAKGQYNPGTSCGQRLLGHELTHVVQQRNGRVNNPYGYGITVIQDPGLEVEAERIGLQVALQPKMKIDNNFAGQNVVQPYDPLTFAIGAGLFTLGLIGTYAYSKGFFSKDNSKNKKLSNKNQVKTFIKQVENKDIKSTKKKKKKLVLKTIEDKSSIEEILINKDIEEKPEILITEGIDDEWILNTSTKKVKIKLTPEELWERDYNHNIDQIEYLLTSSIDKYAVYTKKEKPEREGCVKFGPSYSVTPKNLREDVYNYFSDKEGDPFKGGYIHIVEKSGYNSYNITLHKKYKASNPKTMVNLHIE